MLIDYNEMSEQERDTFICEDCQRELHYDNKDDSDSDICNDCLEENYEDETGSCKSTYNKYIL